jgi:hypothetical protein
MKSEQIEKIVDLAATLASRADEYDQVLILYRTKQEVGRDDYQGSMDNGLELRDVNWLVDGFKFWMQACAAGRVKRKGEDE